MKVSIQFQYMPNESRRPIDGSDANEITRVEDGHFLAIPNVGDTVSYESYEYNYEPDGKLIKESGRVVMVARKVKTRHYDYYPDGVSVNIVVVDVPAGAPAY